MVSLLFPALISFIRRLIVFPGQQIHTEFYSQVNKVFILKFGIVTKRNYLRLILNKGR